MVQRSRVGLWVDYIRGAAPWKLSAAKSLVHQHVTDDHVVLRCRFDRRRSWRSDCPLPDLCDLASLLGGMPTAVLPEFAHLDSLNV